MPIIILLVIVGVVVGAIYNNIQAQKRREGLIDLARRLNLSFDAGEHYTFADAYSFLKELDKGDNRYATNILSGTYRQNQVVAFDYHYETHSTDAHGNSQTQHHWFSFLILTLPALFPGLTIRREGIFTKIAEVFGYQAIKFESAEFSQTFCVRSPDKKFAYDVCNANMIEYLLANKDLSVEIENQVIALAFNTRISVEEIENDLQRLVEIRARLPEYLFTSQ
ncbi:MAG TPA: hypothetical protein VN048_16430 [Verrucomicrobiae bacterium]|nr:hypothetical protein [Verrucomicrobiae bacterium]